MKFQDVFLKAVDVSVPIVAISTPDPADTIRVIYNAFEQRGRDIPYIISWDVSQGVRCPIAGEDDSDPIKSSTAIASAIRTLDGSSNETIGNPVLFLQRIPLVKLAPEKVIFVMHNAQNFFNDAMVRQAIANLRQHNKVNFKTLVLLGPSFILPPELVNDVLVLDAPYPTDEQLREMILSLDRIACDSIKGRKPLDENMIEASISALRGLSLFAAEQHFSMSLTKASVDIRTLHYLRKGILNQVPGLRVDESDLTFEDVGGLDHIKSFLTRLFKTRKRSLVVVRIEEIEKVMAGARGDLSGVSQDALQVLLTALQDNGWEGLIAFGPPGSGKSLISQVLAREFDCLSLAFDLGACKGSLVGESERKIREAIKRIHGIGGKNVFFIATCNNADSLPAELKRRFNRGIWMFDLPNRDERQKIWDIHLRRYKLNKPEKLPSDVGWSGANIQQCVDLAVSLDMSIEDVAKRYIISASSLYAALIEKAREEARNNYLSANYDGVYVGPKEGSISARKSERNLSLS